MANLDINQATTTSLSTQVQDYSVPHETPDQDDSKETYYDFPNAAMHLGYYKNIPELKSAVDALRTWTVGKGLMTNNKTKVRLDRINGWGKDTIQSILSNMIVQKKIFGDAFAEIIRNENGELVNLKPLYTGDMRIVVKDGLIVRYEQRTRPNKDAVVKFRPQEILHLSNDRLANEIHGISVIDQVKWVIDARNEAMADWRRISHRSTVRVLYVEFDNATEISTLKSQYKDAIKNGEVLILPGKRNENEFQDISLPPVEAFMRWIQYLENFFYQAVNVPRVIATSENYTEAASKVGYITFEPIYTSEQTLLEAEIFAQLGLKVTFNRPPSLTGVVSEDEQKNTGQTRIQPNEVQATAGRVE